MRLDAAWHEDGLSFAVLPLMFATIKVIAVAHSYADGAAVEAEAKVRGRRCRAAQRALRVQRWRCRLGPTTQPAVRRAPCACAVVQSAACD